LCSNTPGDFNLQAQVTKSFKYGTCDLFKPAPPLKQHFTLRTQSLVKPPQTLKEPKFRASTYCKYFLPKTGIFFSDSRTAR
ncbi:hypothetical protein NDU88_008984, partial [Pleurodeles waltl]